MSEKIGLIINTLVAIGLLGFGLVYLSNSEFMPYHSQATSIGWDGVEQSMQFLILALMKTIGGGFIVSAVLIAFLQYKFFTVKLSWIPPLILVVSIITYGSSIYAQILVRINTLGNPPTALSILAIVTLIVGYILNRISIQDN